MTNQYILIFTEAAEGGVNYTLFAHDACASGTEAKPMFTTCYEAKQNDKGGYPSIYRETLSSDGLDIDFALNWRPTSLFPTTYDEGHFSTAAITDSIIATYPDSTTVVPIVLLSPEACGSDDGPKKRAARPETPAMGEQSMSIPFLDKKDPTDHLPIFPGFRSCHMFWLNADDDWMILQRRYDGKQSPSTTTARRLGHIDSECSRLVVSLMSGQAFFTLNNDPPGTVHVWEFLGDAVDAIAQDGAVGGGTELEGDDGDLGGVV